MTIGRAGMRDSGWFGTTLAPNAWGTPPRRSTDACIVLLLATFANSAFAQIPKASPAGTPTASIPNVIDQYIALDARLAWRPRQNLEIAVVGQNLLDLHHPESGTSTALRAPLVEIQRGVYGKVTWVL